MSAAEHWPLATALLVFAVAAAAFGLMTLGRRRRMLVQRLRARRAGAAERVHGISPAVDTARLRKIENRIGDGQGRARRWLLANGFETGPRRLALLLGLAVAAAAGLGLAVGLPALLAVLGAAVLVPGLTLLVGRRRLAARMKRAEQQFPGVLGTMVRTLQSGLTLQDAMQLVAAEGPDPLRTEFARILNDEAIGLTLPDACQRMALRLPFDAAEFFALIVAIQTETGGSIVTALENLTETTEARAALADKIVIAGQEARASAAIIGSLPVVVLVMLSLVQPDFVGVLFYTLKGQIALASAAGMVVLGTLVMREMAKFDG